MEEKEITDKVIIDGWFTRARAVQSIEDLNSLMNDMTGFDYDTWIDLCKKAGMDV